MKKYGLLVLFFMVFIVACEPPFSMPEPELPDPDFPPEHIDESVDSCDSDDDCVIVEPGRCDGCDCVKVINKRHLEYWNKEVELRRNDVCDFVCEPCIDFGVKEVKCVNNVCSKVLTK